MTTILRGLAGLSVLTLLACLLLPPSPRVGVLVLSLAWDIAFDLAFAAGIVGLVATAQRASWGWFTGVLLAITLGVLSLVVVDVLLPYLGLAHPLLRLVCSTDGACSFDTYAAVLLHGLAPVVVLLSTVSHPQPNRLVGAHV